MKVLTILTTRFDISGITNSVMNHYRYMDKRDMVIDFVAPNRVPHRLRNEIEKNGDTVYELLMRNRNPIKYFRKLKDIIVSGSYDIVHAHGNSCTLAVEMLAAKQAGVKVRIAHSRNTTCKHRYLHKLLRPFFNKGYTHGFACGTEAGNWLFGSKEFTVMTNGNDVEKFMYNENIRGKYRARYNLKGKKVIGHVGIFNYQKNHEFLIDVFHELLKISPEYILMLVGDGEFKTSIEQKVNDLGLRDHVIFVGKSLEVEKLIQAMDVMVLPSHYEGLPNVVIEWQIACLPSVVSNEVTSECKLTNLVEFLDLQLGASVWAKKIDTIKKVDKSSLNEGILTAIRDAGFDVKENAKSLKKLYHSFIVNYI